jgi:DNA (cytosine-5)-methyltransferase 1
MRTDQRDEALPAASCSPLRHLDLFSGIGGFALAARMVGGIETVGFCEVDPWAQKVLAKNFPGVPIHDNVKTLDPDNYGTIELITGGYPCQPFSSAGKRRGAEDDRHLWPELLRILGHLRPRWALCENVAGHITMGLDEVLSDLEGIGYSAQAIIIPACAIGAQHRRDRVWILAHAVRGKRKMERNSPGSRWEPKQIEGNGIRQIEMGSCFCRDFDGVPRALDRLRGLGNAIVPQVAAEILNCMMRVDSCGREDLDTKMEWEKIDPWRQDEIIDELMELKEQLSQENSN